MTGGKAKPGIMNLLLILAQAVEGCDVGWVGYSTTGQVVKGDIRLTDGDEVWPQPSYCQLSCTGQHLHLKQWH